MTVTLDDLRALCGTGLAHLHGWASYEARNIVTIPARPQMAFRPTRLMLLPINTSDRWLIHEITIGGQRHLAPGLGALSFPLSGSVINGQQLNFPTIGPAQDLTVYVEYVGDLEDGETFIGSFIGNVVDTSSVTRLDLMSHAPILPSSRRVLLDLGDVTYRFEVRRGKLERIAVGNAGELIQSADGTVWSPMHPVMVSLHAEALSDDGNVLFGIDEATGLVVFDFFNLPRLFTARCDLAGYVPAGWWDEIRR
jgi:hypothetical protein